MKSSPAQKIAKSYIYSSLVYLGMFIIYILECAQGKTTLVEFLDNVFLDISGIFFFLGFFLAVFYLYEGMTVISGKRLVGFASVTNEEGVEQPQPRRSSDFQNFAPLLVSVVALLVIFFLALLLYKLEIMDPFVSGGLMLLLFIVGGSVYVVRGLHRGPEEHVVSSSQEGQTTVVSIRGARFLAILLFITGYLFYSSILPMFLHLIFW